MSENPNRKHDQNQSDTEDIRSYQNTTENGQKADGTDDSKIGPSGILQIDPNNPYLKTDTGHHHHHHRHHHRKCSRWQKITWMILALILLIGCIVAGMVHRLPVTYRIVMIAALVIFALLAAIWSFHKYHHKGRRTVVIINIVLIIFFTLTGAFGAVAYQDVRKVKPYATQLKTDLKSVTDDIRNEDTAGADKALKAVNSDNAAIKKAMNHPVWKIAARVPVVGKQIQSVNTVTDIVDEASSKVISPLLTQMNSQPLSQLKVGDGFNVTLIDSYLDFLDQIKPVLSDMNQKVQGLDLSLTGEGDSVEEYKKTFRTIMDGCDKYVPVLKTILGDGSDRNYLFVAQNLAEGRTNGGFPGSAGIITISNGVLNIGDFEKIYDLIPSPSAPADVAQTAEEVTLFDNKMVNNWDANYTPDFSRAGAIWARSYEDQNGPTLNGVISLTPSVIQDALKEFNTSITLSDGTVMDGTNAAKVMAYDLYYRYLGHDADVKGTSALGNDITDALFSETASKAKSILTDNFSFGNLNKYTELLNKSEKDGTFLVWMKDAKEEKTIVNAGISGILTDGVTSNGDTGFYWSFDSACKMGWFMNLDSKVGDPVENGNGTTTYPVTVTMKNSFTNADRDNGSQYILGNYNGNLQGQLHLTAPLGGKITDLKVNNSTDTPMTEATYEGLQIFYNNMTVVQPGKTMTVTYKVTVPAGVKNLNLKITPSYKNYR